MEGLTQNEKIIWNCWEAKSPREVVREAAAKGTHISLAIKYLIKKNGWNETTAKEWFHAEVSTWVVQLLMRQQIFKVLHILNKVEINPEQHLMIVAKDSAEIAFRDFIVEQLQKIRKDFKPESVTQWELFYSHWNLLRYLEKSFETDGTFKQNKVFGINKNRIIVNESEIKSLTINMVEKYPHNWKSKISACLFFDCFEFSLLDFCTPPQIWYHLLEYNKAMILMRWINIQMSEVVRDKNSRFNFFNNDNFEMMLLKGDKTNKEALNKLDELFRQWPITQDMINDIPNIQCFDYTKMCIYDTLCSYGIIQENEKNNIFAILSRLSRTQNLRMIDDVFTESCATLSKNEFYLQLASYFIRNKLYNTLTVCVDSADLGSDFSDVPNDIKDCIQLWSLFRTMESHDDRQNLVMPIYKTCQQIAKDNINDYIAKNPNILLSLILLDTQRLFDIFKQNDTLHFKEFNVINKCQKDKLPHLYSVFAKYKNKNVLESQDINVYQLLSNYKGLDVSKIFEFQLINQNQKNSTLSKPDRRSLGSLITNELNTATNLTPKSLEMPHFDNEKLAKRYGYIANLNFVYYLRQSRPCKGSQSIVTQQYQMYNRLQDKGIKTACSEAHAIALHNWNDPSLTACVISFVAMIGCNPTRCRVHISTANIIKNYMINVMKMSTDAAIKSVNEYMTKILQGDVHGLREILDYLEEITLHKTAIAQDTEGSIDMSYVLYESQTVVKFAVLHDLPLPIGQLREFLKKNLWFNFILFGDVFRYPQTQMLQLSKEFENPSYSEHFKHIIMHRSVDEISADKEYKFTSNGQRNVARLNSVEFSTALSNCEIIDSWTGSELWEVSALCHGPEDPPGALIRAAKYHNEPILVLIASCYEPNAISVLWAHFVLAALGDAVPVHVRDSLQLDISQQHPSDEDFQRVCELSLEVGYVRTLHESMIVFLPDSPLTMLTGFLCACIWQHSFGVELLNNFMHYCQRKYSSECSSAWNLPRQALHKIAVSLVNIALKKSFDSAYHQRKFLKCLNDSQFGKDFLVPCPDYTAMYQILQISMETSIVISMSRLLEENKECLPQCLENYIACNKYEAAVKIAQLTSLPVNSILLSEWTKKYETLSLHDATDADLTMFIANASEAFKKAAVSFTDSVSFLVQYAEKITEPTQKFYSYRIILSWFYDNFEYGCTREKLEHQMWDAYFQTQNGVFLNTHQTTLQFVLNGQKDQGALNKVVDKPFSMLLSEIDIESDIANIETIVLLEEPDVIDVWRKALTHLLELKLVTEAFRLSVLFQLPTEYSKCPACPVQIVRTTLKLAEGTCSPYELPQELRLVISSLHNKLTVSDNSDASFEELVVITEKVECSEPTVHLAAREDADRLSALEALAARSSLTVAKQVASFYRIALQIGWNYNTVLKYKSSPIELLSYVSGRARMTLANLVFRTFNVSSKQISEFLCNEMVAAIISPHLVKSSFRQKEHFQYTLWGYPLNSDVEMFLNMRPDACIQIGRLMLDHLMAFRKIYKCQTSKVPEGTLDDSPLDLDTLIDEEYQTVEEDELVTLTSKSSLESELTVDTESVYSVSTVYASKLTKESRRNLFDIISKNNIHIRYEVKSNVRRITKGAKLSTKQVNIISIELLVLAHECFSCACDTEGVAVVLRSAQALTAQLLAARSYRLMVRLLTGLARYTEMAYVFQALRDNHQFEFLLGQFDYMLGQQQEKITEFKQGLLDFLKNHCPGDTDTYIMVALHFNMNAEAANVIKKQAYNLIESLEKMAIDNAKASSKRPYQPPQWVEIHDNASTRSLLETALNHCTDAAEFYLQGGCMGFAGEMAALAQQIALQISLLNASPTRLVLNRSNEQIYSLVSEYLSFMEGLVLMCGGVGGGVAEARWRELAYRRVLNNDQAYLRDMAAYRPDLALSFLARYKTEKRLSAVSQAAMTELKNLVK